MFSCMILCNAWFHTQTTHALCRNVKNRQATKRRQLVAKSEITIHGNAFYINYATNTCDTVFSYRSVFLGNTSKFQRVLVEMLMS